MTTTTNSGLSVPFAKAKAGGVEKITPEVSMICSIMYWLRQNKYTPHAHYLPQVGDDVFWFADLYEQFLLTLPEDITPPALIDSVPSSKCIRCTIVEISKPYGWYEKVKSSRDASYASLTLKLVVANDQSTIKQLYTETVGFGAGLGVDETAPAVAGATFEVMYHPFHDVADFLVLHEKVCRANEYASVLHGLKYAERENLVLQIWFAQSNPNGTLSDEKTVQNCEFVSKNPFRLRENMAVWFEGDPELYSYSSWELEYPTSPEAMSMVKPLWQPIRVFVPQDDVLTRRLDKLAQKSVLVPRTVVSDVILDGTVQLLQKRLKHGWYRTAEALDADFVRAESCLDQFIKNPVCKENDTVVHSLGASLIPSSTTCVVQSPIPILSASSDASLISRRTRSTKQGK